MQSASQEKRGISTALHISLLRIPIYATLPVPPKVFYPGILDHRYQAIMHQHLENMRTSFIKLSSPVT
jgi:hypothetical protein